MSLEPKKPIEELLEVTAKARREQFGPEPKMPNPMRAQLHHEISRVGRGDESRQSRHWFHIFWPRLAFTTVIALILVSISTLWWWHEHPSRSGEAMKLAMQEPASKAATPAKALEQGAAVGPAAVPAASASAFADTKAAASQPAEVAKNADGFGRFTAMKIAPGSAPATDEFSAGAKNKSDEPLLADKSLVAKEASTAAPAAASLTHSQENFRQQSSRNGLTQSFRSKLKQTTSILNEFEVEQFDHEIRLVDADGSTYTGKLEPLPQNDSRSIYNRKRNYNAPSPGAAPSFDENARSTNAEFYFRATGYNTSLKKSFEIEGNYFGPLTIAQKKVAKTKTESEARDEEAPARITGVAKIQGESPVQIDAVAVP